MKTTDTDLERFVNETLAGDIRRLDSKQRHARIIAAAIQECSEKGFRDAAMVGIAKRARVSTATLYLDFGTRESLLEAAVAFASPMIAAELVHVEAETEPRARLVSLLIRHCALFNHPHASWLYRAHVSGELPKDSMIHRYAQSARRQVEDFWAGELALLHDRNVLSIPNINQAVNFLLGTVQRRSLLAMLLFGMDDVAEPNIEAAAKSAVDWLFGQYAQQEIGQDAVI